MSMILKSILNLPRFSPFLSQTWFPCLFREGALSLRQSLYYKKNEYFQQLSASESFFQRSFNDTFAQKGWDVLTSD